MRQMVTDFIVVGSGIAGLSTALSLAASGQVMILTKACEQESNSFRAQGGIAAAVGAGDSPELHRQDTLRTGANLCDPTSVDVLVRSGPQTIQLLTRWGTCFDRKGDEWALGREGAHSVSRILHVEGDSTGAGITRSLLQQASLHPQIQLFTHTLVADLLIKDGVCRGVVAVDVNQAPVYYLARKGVVLATGGCGQVYRYTTNDRVSTGDGFAMAYRAGAKLTDMEFIQFHPTALALEQNPMFLVSEAVRGEGAILVNDGGEAFMKRYHEWQSLAPRDVVARAIYCEMQAGHQIYLDATMIKSSFAERFPAIDRQCKKFGIDPGKDWIPVTPAAHFIMGGIKTDLYGQTTIPRLFACGEVACTGVHGANRLASNSLLEGAVFAQRIGDRLAILADQTTEAFAFVSPSLCNHQQMEQTWKEQMRQIMWDYAGIVRSSSGLSAGILQLKQLSEQIGAEYIECHNMLTTAHIIMKAALWRKESRGGHYRYDFPEMIPAWSQKHQVI
jgi:L-aspartate oxidase